MYVRLPLLSTTAQPRSGYPKEAVAPLAATPTGFCNFSAGGAALAFTFEASNRLPRHALAAGFDCGFCSVAGCLRSRLLVRTKF
ncbi:hypothetical protein HPB50_001607 [Hyalomma asiaticum]|uniref:Uncharacterized protein n=1 Tax=Hyalomma asiaticum TaxID=266040 RepID=A0ACB7RXV9_HYAAI|nr:hypothetical protein HPB50_001607 [Hyalomma asiaticum]